MTTSLGGAQTTGAKVMVRNFDSSNKLKKGTVVALIVSANNPAAVFLDLTRNKDYGAGTERQLDIPYVNVVVAPVDSATPGGVSRLGVLAADLPPGGYGEAIVFGMALVLFGGTVAVGDVITSDASGKGIDAANASHKNPFGMALENAVNNDLKWCFVNFYGPGGVTSTGFMGKAY